MNDNKQAILLLASELSPLVLDRFFKFSHVTQCEKFILLDATRCECVEEGYISPFVFADIVRQGYLPIASRLVPGSNHFPVIDFIVRHNFDYVWLVEYDVVFSGDWGIFFESQDSSADLLAAKLCRHSQMPKWHWWRTLAGPQCLSSEDMRHSFNPIYRLSKRAAIYLKNCYLAGWRGHHEATMATLLNIGLFCIEDIGGTGEFVRKSNSGKWYSDFSHDYKIRGNSPRMNIPNFIWHPAKT